MAILEGQVQIMTIIIIDHGLSNDEVETRFEEDYFAAPTLALKIKKGLCQAPSGGYFLQLRQTARVTYMGTGMVPGDPLGIFGDKKKVQKNLGKWEIFSLSPSILDLEARFFFPDDQNLILNNFYLMGRVEIPNGFGAIGEKPFENGDF